MLFKAREIGKFIKALFEISFYFLIPKYSYFISLGIAAVNLKMLEFCKRIIGSQRFIISWINEALKFWTKIWFNGKKLMLAMVILFVNREERSTAFTPAGSACAWPNANGGSGWNIQEKNRNLLPSSTHYLLLVWTFSSNKFCSNS